MILTSLEVQGHTVPHWKALRYGNDESRGISYNSTLNICQDVLKSGNLLHKRGFDDSQSHTTVISDENSYLRIIPPSKL